MDKFGIFVFLLQLMQILAKNAVSYKGYRVYKVSNKGLNIPELRIPNLKDTVSVLTEHHEFDDGHNPFTVRCYLIPRHSDEDFRKALDLAGAKYNISVEDLEHDIEEERRSLETGRRSEAGDWNVTGKYFSYDEIIKFIKYMETYINPVNDKPLAVVESIGQSLEGREMYVVKISSDHCAQKPIIFFEAGIHAREWTAPSAALYMIHQLVVNHTYTAKVLEDIDFYIIPVSNPDGYEYSRSTDRLWRKTRSFFRGHYGVDGNRNFDFHWGEAGTSGNPASEIFRGPYPFSEVETRNIRDAGIRYQPRINIFVSVHAFGPCILYPWSYKITAPAPQASLMEKIAKDAAHVIKRYSGTEYTYGVSSAMMYEAAGGVDDYFKGVLGVDLSFTVELSSAKKSSFIIPTSKIYEIVSEAFEGFKVMAEYGARYKRKSIYRRGDQKLSFC